MFGEFLGADELYTSLYRPVEVKLSPTVVGGTLIENPVISMYCQFSKEEVFDFKSPHVVYITEVLPKIAEFYIKTAEEMYSIDINSVTIKDFAAEPAPKEEKKDGMTIDEILQNVNKTLH